MVIVLFSKVAAGTIKRAFLVEIVDSSAYRVNWVDMFENSGVIVE